MNTWQELINAWHRELIFKHFMYFPGPSQEELEDLARRIEKEVEKRMLDAVTGAA